MERKAYTVQEVAEMLGMSKEGVYRLIRNGLLRAVRIGISQGNKSAPQRLRIPADAIDEFLQGGSDGGNSRVAN